jgi:hypothetical protein
MDVTCAIAQFIGISRELEVIEAPLQFSLPVLTRYHNPNASNREIIFKARLWST